MKRIFYFLLTACLLSACNTNQEKQPADLASFIKNTTDSTFKKHDLPGIFVAVINNNERSYYSNGFADPDTKTLFDSATVFEIASITKTFTAFVLMRVLQDKHISDSSSIISFLPDSVHKNKALKNISFLSLMNHTSGLPRLPDNMAIDVSDRSPYDHYRADDLYKYLQECKPVPDGKSNYSNLGFGLAGVLAARISGKTYDSLLNEYIYQPFKMEAPGNSARKAQGYFATGKTDFWKMDVLAPAGGIRSSATEMLNYLQYMSHPTDSFAGRIIDDLLQPTVRLSPKVNVCRAWHTLEEKDGRVIYWHNGGTYGFSIFAAFVKGRSGSVIVVTNKFNANEASDGLGIMIMKEMLK
jgi:CubicO group peptidase (beta-lactamase class C family)